MEDELVNIEIDSFDKLSIVDLSVVGKTSVIIDINISIKEDKEELWILSRDYRLVEDVQLDR